MTIKPTLMYCTLRLIIAVGYTAVAVGDTAVAAEQPQQWALLRRNRINTIGPKEFVATAVSLNPNRGCWVPDTHKD